MEQRSSENLKHGFSDDLSFWYAGYALSQRDHFNLFHAASKEAFAYGTET